MAGKARRLALIGALVAISIAVVVVLAGSPDRRGARVQRWTVGSRFVHRDLGVVAVTPGSQPQAGRRGLVVFLHGRGASPDAYLTSGLFDALARLGSRAPELVFPDGGDHSYWHDRGSGAWGRYVLGEVIPAAIRRLGADPRRVAIGGISMGGFGALDLARLHPRRFCAVGAHSAAIYATGSSTAAGAFDDAQDFARHDVLAVARTDPDVYHGRPTWIDVGAADAFRSTDVAFARALRRGGDAVTLRVWPGGHDDGYWRAHWPSYLRFYANALARRCPARIVG